MQDKRQVQEGKDYEQDKENGRCLAKYQAIKDKENAQKRKQYQQDKENKRPSRTSRTNQNAQKREKCERDKEQGRGPTKYQAVKEKKNAQKKITYASIAAECKLWQRFHTHRHA